MGTRIFLIILLSQVFSWTALINAQEPQGFFLDNWTPKSITSPAYNNTLQTVEPVTAVVTIDFADTLSRISKYLFGDNANLWTGCMSDNKSLMKHIADRNIGVLRGPGGSISDVFFWNRNADHRPSDVPATLMGSTEPNWPWYGDRPNPWETWTMAVDSFYSILGKVNATGMLTVNYGYARYGTGIAPVANAAHMAADWVRYDRGRTKFWEIGNEVSGSWEAGYRIDRTLNKDGQPEFINGTLYGQHCVVFIDSMKAAAQKAGFDIRIGVVMAESGSSAWNKDVAAMAGNKADYYIVHSYFTPYNQNSDITTILNSSKNTGSYKAYVWGEVDKSGKPHLPIALTEYNIFAVGSNQPVSHINGMHAVLVTGELMKNGYGAGLRWDLANGWSNGDDHGMFSYGSEPGISTYAPRPAFYHLYYLQKYTGDVLLNSKTFGSTDITVIPTAFHSGQSGIALVNTSRGQNIVRLNIKNFRFGERYYMFTLTGLPNVDFSRKVFVNGSGNSLDAGGPEDYETIKASSSTIGEEIRIKVPPLSVVFLLVDPGSKELVIDEEITSAGKLPDENDIVIYPNPSDGTFSIRNLPAGISAIGISDNTGRTIIKDALNVPGTTGMLNYCLGPGIYFLTIRSKAKQITRKLVIN